MLGLAPASRSDRYRHFTVGNLRTHGSVALLGVGILEGVYEEEVGEDPVGDSVTGRRRQVSFFMGFAGSRPHEGVKGRVLLALTLTKLVDIEVDLPVGIAITV